MNKLIHLIMFYKLKLKCNAWFDKNVLTMFYSLLHLREIVDLIHPSNEATLLKPDQNVQLSPANVSTPRKCHFPSLSWHASGSPESPSQVFLFLSQVTAQIMWPT